MPEGKFTNRCSNYSTTGMPSPPKSPWVATLHSWLDGESRGPWGVTRWRRKGLGTAGMDRCQYSMSLAALLGPSLKTSDIRLLRVYQFTIWGCKEASVQKAKKWENRPMRSRCLVSAGSLPLSSMVVWRVKTTRASDDMMRRLCSHLTSSSGHRPHS